MARLRRNSRILDLARQRIAGLASIDPNIDLGNGASLATLSTERDALENLLARYNESLASCDELKNHVAAAEKLLLQRLTITLSAVKLRFGDDSNEYEKAGGIRRSERKRPARKAKPAP